MIQRLEDFKVYGLAMNLGESIWGLVAKWNYFERDTIAANLSEGFGRYHFKEKKNFGYYSRGSLYETKT